jgi:hypothetical protein
VSVLRELKIGIHDSDVSSLSISHKIHHISIIALCHLILYTCPQKSICDISGYKQKPQSPEESCFFTWELSQNWHFFIEDGWDQSCREEYSDYIVDKIYPALPSLTLLII